MKPRLEIKFPLKSQWAFWTGKPYEPAQGEFLLNHARSGILLALQALDVAGKHKAVVAVFEVSKKAVPVRPNPFLAPVRGDIEAECSIIRPLLVLVRAALILVVINARVFTFRNVKDNCEMAAGTVFVGLLFGAKNFKNVGSFRELLK